MGCCALIVAAELGRNYRRKFITPHEIASIYSIPIARLEPVISKMVNLGFIGCAGQNDDGLPGGQLSMTPIQLNEDPRYLYAADILKYFTSYDFTGIFVDEEGKWQRRNLLSAYFQREIKWAERTLRNRMKGLSVEKLSQIEIWPGL